MKEMHEQREVERVVCCPTLLREELVWNLRRGGVSRQKVVSYPPYLPTLIIGDNETTSRKRDHSSIIGSRFGNETRARF